MNWFLCVVRYCRDGEKVFGYLFEQAETASQAKAKLLGGLNKNYELVDIVKDIPSMGGEQIMNLVLEAIGERNA